MLSAWVEMLGGEVKYYMAGTVKTRCLEAGDGEPLILLHGMGGHAETYIRNVVSLSRRFHVYAIDFVGHGFSDKPDLAYNIPDFVNHVRDFMQAVGIRQAHLSGESLGGWVSAWLAVESPEQVKKLLLNTAAGFHSPQSPAIAELRELSLKALASPTRESVRKRLEWLVHDPRQMIEEIVEVRYHITQQKDFQQSMRKILNTLLGDSVTDYLLTDDTLGKIRVPTLFLWTTHNPGTPPEVAQKKQKLVPGSQFYLMEGCGHWPQFEQPEEFNNVALNFFSQ